MNRIHATRASDSKKCTRSIPFRLPDIGLREISGEVYLDLEFLVFEVEDALVGEFDKDQLVIKIEPGALEAINLDRGLFQHQICIRPKKRDLLDAMPGGTMRSLNLKVWRWHRKDAEHLINEVKRRKEKHRLR